jgi:hypothetical protein
MCGLPLFPPRPRHENPARPGLFRPRDQSGYARVAGRSEAVLAGGLNGDGVPRQLAVTPASARVCSSKGREPR